MTANVTWPGGTSSPPAALSCSAGRFANLATGIRQGVPLCEACPPGHYSAGGMATACRACEAGEPHAFSTAFLSAAVLDKRPWQFHQWPELCVMELCIVCAGRFQPKAGEIGCIGCDGNRPAHTLLGSLAAQFRAPVDPPRSLILHGS